MSIVWGKSNVVDKFSKGSNPDSVKASTQYGCGVRALVTKLSVEHKMPMEQISRLFADLYGYELNSKTIENVLEQGYQLVAPWKQRQ